MVKRAELSEMVDIKDMIVDNLQEGVLELRIHHFCLSVIERKHSGELS